MRGCWPSATDCLGHAKLKTWTRAGDCGRTGIIEPEPSQVLYSTSKAVVCVAIDLAASFLL